MRVPNFLRPEALANFAKAALGVAMITSIAYFVYLIKKTLDLTEPLSLNTYQVADKETLPTGENHHPSDEM